MLLGGHGVNKLRANLLLVAGDSCGQVQVMGGHKGAWARRTYPLAHLIYNSDYTKVMYTDSLLLDVEIFLKSCGE